MLARRRDRSQPARPRSSPAARQPAGYPLAERTLDLFIEPRRLFEDLARTPRTGGALLLSICAGAALSVARFATFEIDLPAGVVLAFLALETAVGCVAVVAMAVTGLIFAGFSGVHVSFRSWLALAAHCSLARLPILSLETAAALLLTERAGRWDLANLLDLRPQGFWPSWLSHASLTSAAFVALFGLGAGVLTGRRPLVAIAFTGGFWASLWFAISWFVTGGA